MSTRPGALAMESLCLKCKKLADTTRGEIEHGIELVAAKRVSFRRTLNFHESAAVIHHDIHVGFGLRILSVVEIQHRDAGENAYGDRRDLPVKRARYDRALLDQRFTSVRQRQVSASNRRSTRAAVGLEDIAVDGNGAFTERLEIG